MTSASLPICRACSSELRTTFVDLGMTPLANSYLAADELERPEPVYPLHARVCEQCLLVQIEPAVTPSGLFDEYAYFSSYSDSWVLHARRFADMTRSRFGLTDRSQVVEIASNDGYLLKHFIAANVPALGIEPARNVAAVATAQGIPTEVTFFGNDTATDLCSRGIRADLLVANNVLAHVPELNDFVEGLKTLLAPSGVLSIEFPHLLRLIEGVQFDTIYHEHFSYFSLLSVERILASHGLRIFDLEQLPTHGGSLRLLACHCDSDFPEHLPVEAARLQEEGAGLNQMETYGRYNQRVIACRRAFLEFLNGARNMGQTVVAYGAAAKGNTLLNFAGVGVEEIAYVADRSPHKQGRYLPGSHIPIVSPAKIDETRPDVIVVLAWNLIDEVKQQLSHVTSWGGRFVVPIPTTHVVV